MLIDDSTKQVFDKAFEPVRQGVVAAADTLKTYAPQLWALARRQVVLEGVELLVGAVFLLILATVGIVLLRRGYSDQPEYSRDGRDRHDTNLFTWVIIVATLIPVAALLVNAADLLLNPDYWTLMRILEMGH